MRAPTLLYSGDSRTSKAQESLGLIVPKDVISDLPFLVESEVLLGYETAVTGASLR